MQVDFLLRNIQLLHNPKTKAAYDALEAEDEIIRAMIEAQIQSGMTEEELSERTGIAQTEINELTNGGADLKLSVLQRLAAGLGMRLWVDFQPVTA